MSTRRERARRVVGTIPPPDTWVALAGFGSRFKIYIYIYITSAFQTSYWPGGWVSPDLEHHPIHPTIVCPSSRLWGLTIDLTIILLFIVLCKPSFISWSPFRFHRRDYRNMWTRGERREQNKSQEPLVTTNRPKQQQEQQQ